MIQIGKSRTDNVATTSKKIEVIYGPAKNRKSRRRFFYRDEHHVTNISDLPCHILVFLYAVYIKGFQQYLGVYLCF